VKLGQDPAKAARGAPERRPQRRLADSRRVQDQRELGARRVETGHRGGMRAPVLGFELKETSQSEPQLQRFPMILIVKPCARVE
jgi:hypothetical protein